MMPSLQLNKLFFFLFIVCSIHFSAQEKSKLDSMLNECQVLKNNNSPLFVKKAHTLYSGLKGQNLPEKKLALENLFGIYYTINQKFDSGFVYFSSALKSAEALKDSEMVINTTMNIGVLFRKQSNFSKSEKYFLQALDICKLYKMDRLKMKVLYNFSGLYLENKKNLAAIKLNRESYQLSVVHNDIGYQIKSLQALGSNYAQLRLLDTAKTYLQAAFDMAKANSYDSEIPFLCNNLGSVYSELKNYQLAEQYLFEAERLNILNENKNSLEDVYLNLCDLFKNKNDFKTGLYYFYKADSLKTLIYNENIQNTALELEEKYQTEKKDLQIQNQSLELESKQKENEAKNKILLFGAIGFLGIAVFAFIAYSNFNKTKKANLIINSQKAQVELQKEEIIEQKQLVEEKQKEIVDSINYAQKIQAAVLTGDEVWKKITPDYFILFQPKDIVSGDFYWAFNSVNSRSVFALADCTGHGVPGGFMSMLGNSFLNELVVENKVFAPHEILNKLRQKIITSLGQKGASDRRDGMDMAICTWNKLNNTLEFAGANNKLWIIRNGTLQEISGDKMPIGNFEGELKPFTSQTIPLEKNDLIVLTTDGFYDQFGGETGKKFMSKNLKTHLVQNCQLPLEEQKSKLTELFKNWRGQNEQIDDVSLIMLKV